MTLDSLDVAAELAVTGQALAATVAAVAESDVPDDVGIDAIVLVGGAASAVPAALVEAIAAPRSSVPVVSQIGGELPGWVGPDSLVLALDTSSTDALLATPAGQRAHLIGLGAADGSTRSILQAGASLAVLGRFGLIGDVEADLMEAAELLTARSGTLGADGSPSARLARRIGRTMPLVYGAGPVGRAAGRAWKQAVNRLAKAPAFTNSIPGLDHDEIVGWAQHGDVTRQVFTLVTLEHGFAEPDDSQRLRETSEICEEIVADVHAVESAATNPTAALFDLSLYGEYVALAMAEVAGIDPGPAPVVERYTT